MKRLPYLSSHMRKLNSEAAEKQKFPTLFVVLCVSWTVAVWFIAQREQEYAREYERVQSIGNEEKTISTHSLKQPRGDYEPLRFTF